MPTGKHSALPLTAALALFLVVVAGCLFLVFGQAPARDPAAIVSADKWTCSMCPQFILPEPGKCPKCFMDLIPLDESAQGGTRLELMLSHAAAAVAEISPAVAEASDDPDREGLVAVPATAVLRNRDRNFVYAESDDGELLTYTFREVGVDGNDGEVAWIRSGLDEGEAVAATGVFRIDSAMQILGKISLVNLPDGDLADAAEPALPPYQPAERGDVDLRAEVPELDRWFRSYEEVRAALAGDKVAAVARPSHDLLSAVSGALSGDSDFTAIRSRLSLASEALDQAADLETRRAAFEKVTAEMVLLARRFGSPSGGLNLVYCPMAFGGDGAYWLQPGATVDNPYHGLEMPLCGWLVEPIPPFAVGGDGDAGGDL